MFSHMPPRFARFALLWLLFAAGAQAQVQFRTLDRAVIEARIEAFSKKNAERELILEKMFAQSGCGPDKIQREVVKKKLPPNLICVVPGLTDRVILVGAHSDHADIGDGVVDNWSGASLLPSLMYSVNEIPRQHTYVFIAFTDEEGGMVGSDYYAKKLSPEQRLLVDAMVNLDTLGLGPTKVWGTHADTALLNALWKVASSMKLPLDVVNVERVGSTDSESFAKYKIPRITIHSVTQETWGILHSDRDALAAIKMNDYYDSYRLLTVYLAFLDTYKAQAAPAAH
jgi:Peptidase family M28